MVVAEDFIEEIYQKSVVPDTLRECIRFFNRSDYPKAKEIYNGAVSVIEKLLPEYAAFDRESAVKLQDAAVEIGGHFGDVSCWMEHLFRR